MIDSLESKGIKPVEFDGFNDVRQCHSDWYSNGRTADSPDETVAEVLRIYLKTV